MAYQPWLDEVLDRLAKRGLPSNYVARLAEELSDHLKDVKEEAMGEEGDVCLRLGKPDQVANAAVAAYRRRGFLGRYPIAAFFVFGVSPVASLAAFVAIAIAGMLVLPDGWDAPLFAGLSRLGNSASVAAAYLGSLLTVIVPSILASILYCRLARRSGIGKRWMLLSCVMLALVAALPMCTARVSDMPDDSWIRIGIWSPQNLMQSYNFFFWIFCRPQQLLQFLVPLAIGCWFVRCSSGNVRPQLAM